MVNSIEKNKLFYPFDKRPKDGALLKVSENIHWLRMPLPIALNHINLWLLEGENGFSIIDSGMSTDESKAIWKNIFSNFIKPKKIENILITHMHLDHSGLAGWLSNQLNLEPYFTQKEYKETQKITGEMPLDQLDLILDYYKKCGYDKKSLEHYKDRINYRKTLSSELVEKIISIKDQDNVQLSDGEWKVIIVEGHSPEHACLYSVKNNIFICGDALLPRITPNVSVNPIKPDSDPLGDWLESLENIKARIPNDALILPSHGYPYIGAHNRIDTIIDNHHNKLENICEFTVKPKSVYELFPLLFKSEINDNSRVLAVGETMSHVNYLVRRGKLEKTIDENGLFSFSRP